jgi:hypothetical protein
MYAIISFYVLDRLVDLFFLYQEIFVYVIHALTSLLLYVHKVVFMYDALFISVFADLMDFKYIVFV